MSISKRQEREKAIIKEQIVKAATELFSLYGVEHVSMRKIAEKIEYSPTTIYNYFKNKNELLFVLLKQGYNLFYQTLSETYKHNENEKFEVKLKEVMKSYITFGLSNKAYYNLMFILNVDKDDSLIGCDNERSKAFETLVLLVREGNRLNFFSETNEMLISQIIWGNLHGITSLQITITNFPWIERELLIDTHLDIIIKGLKKDFH